MNKKRLKSIVILSSLLVFLISLTQAAFVVKQDVMFLKTYTSIEVFLIGGISIIGGAGKEWLVWLANPIYFLAIILFVLKNRMASYFSLVAIALAFWFSQWKEIIANEGGATIPIHQLDTGYWLWLGSILILGIGSFVYFGWKEGKL